MISQTSSGQLKSSWPLSKVTFIVGSILIISVLVSFFHRSQTELELPVIAAVPAFTLTNQDGKAMGSGELLGKVYIANFVFTRCPSICPKMLLTTQHLQTELRGEPSIHFVSFTVDPEYDTPQILRDTSRKYRASDAWIFLTHTDDSHLFKLYSEGFKISVAPAQPAQDLFDIAHSEKMVLVDQRGQIRGYYSQDPASVNELKKAAIFLARHAEDGP